MTSYDNDTTLKGNGKCWVPGYNSDWLVSDRCCDKLGCVTRQRARSGGSITCFSGWGFCLFLAAGADKVIAADDHNDHNYNRSNDISGVHFHISSPRIMSGGLFWRAAGNAHRKPSAKS